MRRSLKQDFNTSMEDLHFSPEAKEEMVQRLMHTQKEQTMCRSNKRKITLIALAGILILATMTGAAVFTRWSRSAQHRYNPSQDIKEQAEKSGLSVMLEETKGEENPKEVLSVTDQGITITAVQSIVDNYSAMIVLRIDGFALPSDETPSLTISSAEITDVHTVIPPGRFDTGIITDASGKEVYADGSPIRFDTDGTVIPNYTAKDGSLEYYAIFSFSKGNAPVGKDINIQISSIGTEVTPAVIRGNWELHWTLAGTPDILRYQPDAVIGSTNVTLLEFEMSPISIYTVYKMDNADGHIHHNDPSSNIGRSEAYETIEFLLTGIRMKDGTVHHLGAATGINTMYSDAGVGHDYPAYEEELLKEKAVLLTKSRLIDRMINPEDVDSLIFQQSLPVQKDISKLTEEDFFILDLS